MLAQKTIKRNVAKVFQPLLNPYRYKGAWGGRGSGKSHNFGENLIDDHLYYPGLRSVCIREVQKSLKESAKRLLEDKIQEMGVGQHFGILNDSIKTPGDGIIIFQGMQDHNAETIKSLEGYDRAWIEEAQTLSARSLQLLRPTIRKEGSELWFSWNPRHKTDPVDRMFRDGEPPENSICVMANWSDNPWFPSVLDAERRDTLKSDPDQYDHIWEGGYVTVVEGAYFASALTKARNEGRVGRVAVDPLHTVRIFVDIGGTGAKSDSFSMWAAQFIGKEIRVIDYYEAQGQEIGEHAAWLRKQGYTPEMAGIWLPHDGKTQDRIYAVSYESAFRDMGYDVTVVPNQGRGAASARIDEGRRLFPRIWFDGERCEGGLEALGWYHEKRDENRLIGLGPEHDWSSHAADSFGLMCVVYSEPTPNKVEKINFKGW